MNIKNFENIKKVKNAKPFTVLDAVILVLIVAAIGVSFWFVFKTPAETVVITAPDYRRELALEKNATIELDCLTVHIENGEVWVTDADCRDKTCEKHGRISRAGQSIVCLPNAVTVSVRGGDSDLQWELG